MFPGLPPVGPLQPTDGEHHLVGEVASCIAFQRRVAGQLWRVRVRAAGRPECRKVLNSSFQDSEVLVRHSPAKPEGDRFVEAPLLLFLVLLSCRLDVAGVAASALCWQMISGLGGRSNT